MLVPDTYSLRAHLHIERRKLRISQKIIDELGSSKRLVREADVCGSNSFFFFFFFWGGGGGT